MPPRDGEGDGFGDDAREHNRRFGSGVKMVDGRKEWHTCVTNEKDR